MNLMTTLLPRSLLLVSLLAAACVGDPKNLGDLSTDTATTEPGETDDSSTTSEPTDTSDTVGDLYPICLEYINDYTVSDLGDACAAEIDCGQHLTKESCDAAAFVHNDEGIADVAVECRWGRVFTGTFEDEACSGQVTEACVAGVFIGEGGPPCFGFYVDHVEVIEALDLGCASPIESQYERCFESEHEQTTCTCTF